MTKITEIVDIQAKTTGGASVKSLKQEIREAQTDAIRLARAFGENSNEANNAAVRVAKLRDEMEDFNNKVKSFNPDKFQALATLTQGIAGGIAAAQGAMSMFGDSGEDAAKQLAKVQGAIAFSQGVQQLLDMRKQIGGIASLMSSKLKAAFTTVTGAARAFGTALGIGIILAGLSVLIEYWDDIKKAVFKLIPGLKNIVGWFTSIVETVTDWLGITSEIERANDRLLENVKKSADKYSRDLEVNSDKYEKNMKAKMELWLAYVNKFHAAAKNEEKLSEEDKNKLLTDLTARYHRDLAALDTARTEEANKEWQKRIEENRKALEQEKQDTEAFFKLGADLKTKSITAERDADEVLRVAKLSQRDQERQALIDKFAEQRKGSNDISASVLLQEMEMQKLEQKFIDEDLANIKKADQEKIDQQKATDKELADLRDKKIVDDKAKADAAQAAKQQMEAQAFSSTSATLGALSKLAKEHSAAQKALVITQIITDTASAISALVAASNKNPYNAVTNGAAGGIQFGVGLIGILANMASAMKLIGGQPPSVAGAGGQAVAQPQVQGASRSYIDYSRIQSGKVYVLEGDITGTQRRVRNAKDVSVF